MIEPAQDKTEPRERVVVTGMGAVCCLGGCVADFWESLIGGRCGLRELTRFDLANHRQKIGGEIEGFTPAAWPDLAIQFAVAAAREAAVMASLVLLPGEARIGVIAASNFGAMDAMQSLLLGKVTRSEQLAEARFAGAADFIAADLKAGGFRGGVSLSCSSGGAAMGWAMELLRRDAADAFVVVGYDSISELAWSGLTALRAMTTGKLLPFDARRDGTIFSEGAGAMILECADAAKRRGARILAEFAGHGENNNAFHMAHPDPDGAGMANAMRMALADAGIAPEFIDHINAHATGTKYNDSIETRAVKTVFGERARAIPINGVKSMLGHAMGAASSLEAIAAVLTIREGVIPPTIGLEEPDPECDLDYVPGKARKADINVVVSNSAGIGGANSVVVFRRYE